MTAGIHRKRMCRFQSPEQQNPSADLRRDYFQAAGDGLQVNVTALKDGGRTPELSNQDSSLLVYESEQAGGGGRFTASNFSLRRSERRASRMLQVDDPSLRNVFGSFAVFMWCFYRRRQPRRPARVQQTGSVQAACLALCLQPRARTDGFVEPAALIWLGSEVR